MATNTSKVFIDIITQFTGSKSIKQAETSFQKLAKSIGRVVSVAAIEEFSRRSVQAFLADDAAAKQLEKTLTNLGVAFNPTSLDSYIQNLQNTTGVLDDELRPAFASLNVATGDYAKAQDLLSTALDVSQGTGKKLSAVTAALSKAYLGNFAALSRLGAGISKADIKAGNLEDILTKLNKNFGGSAIAAADTYAGQIRLLRAAFIDVQETIGKGFVDAFITLVGPDGSATQFANSLRDAGLYIADIIRGLGIVAAKLKPIESFFQKFTGAGAVQNIPVLGSWLTILNDIGKKQRELSAGFMSAAPEPAQIGYAKAAQDKKALAVAKSTAIEEKKKADAAKAAAKAAADKLKTDKANAVLNLAGKVLDTQQAGILAALSKEISQTDKDRLLLQQALLNENADAALKLSQKIISTQLQAVALGALDPLSGWNGSIASVIASLVDLQAELTKVSGVALTGSQLLAKDYAEVVVDAEDPAFEAANKATKDFLANTTAGPIMNGSWNGFGGGGNGTPGTSFPDVVVNVLLDPSTLTTTVTSGQQNTTASGVVVGTSRLNPLN
jgi:hypothetical protein